MSGATPEPTATPLPCLHISSYQPGGGALRENEDGDMPGAVALAIGGAALARRVEARRKALQQRGEELASSVVELWSEAAPALVRQG